MSDTEAELALVERLNAIGNRMLTGEFADANEYAMLKEAATAITRLSAEAKAARAELTALREKQE